MPSVQQRFSVKSALAGLAVVSLAALIIGLTAVRLSARYGKISLPAAIGAPFLLAAGLYHIWKSTRTHLCSQCQQEFRSGVGFFAAGQTPPADLPQILKDIETAPLVEKPTRPYITVSLEYCPSCVSIGLVQAEYLYLSNLKRTFTFPEQEIQGPIVRKIKDTLLL